MKSHPWDELNDSGKDYPDSAGFFPETDYESDISDKRLKRRRLTELRRRTEERLDWKRSYGDFRFDDLDDDHVYGDNHPDEDGDPLAPYGNGPDNGSRDEH